MDKDKIIEILMSDNIVESINENLDTLVMIIPEIIDMIGFAHNHPHHHLDVWNHTLLALSISPKNLEMRLALLLHDIGKPHCYQDGEIRHFRGHPKVSAEISREILKRLKFDDEEIKELCYLIELHDTPIKDSEIIENKELIIKRFNMQLYDGLAHNPLRLEKRIEYLKLISEKINDKQEKENCDAFISKALIKNRQYNINNWAR